MALISKVLRNGQGPLTKFLTWWCPGCKHAHSITYENLNGHQGPCWSWNGDAEKPVFGPSVLVTGRDMTEKGWTDYENWVAAGRPEPKPAFEGKDTVCHTFVGCNGAQPGEIVFLGDCTHELAGKTVPIPDWPIKDWDDGGAPTK